MPATRDDRIKLRATREEKRLLAAAAAYERLDVTSFIMRNVLPAARDEDLDRYAPLKLMLPLAVIADANTAAGRQRR